MNLLRPSRDNLPESVLNSVPKGMRKWFYDLEDRQQRVLVVAVRDSSLAGWVEKHFGQHLTAQEVRQMIGDPENPGIPRRPGVEVWVSRRLPHEGDRIDVPNTASDGRAELAARHEARRAEGEARRAAIEAANPPAEETPGSDPVEEAPVSGAPEAAPPAPALESPDPDPIPE